MIRFYSYGLLVGVSFKDMKGLTVQGTKQRYINGGGGVVKDSTPTLSQVCGT